MRLSEVLNEAPAAAAPAPAVPAQPAATTPVAAKPAGQQPFKPTQVMDPQQAAAANKAAQDFMAQLTAKLQGLVSAQPTNEQRLTEGNWLTKKLAALVDWVTDALKSNPLIEIGLRLIPNPAQPVLAILDVIQAVRSNSVGEAVSSLAKVVGGPAGQQLAQAAQGINIGSAVASGDIAGAARQTASAAGLKDVASGIAAGQVAQAVSETAELNRILRLSGMELIAEGSTKSITVQRGDTLGRIARDNSTTVDAILKINTIANRDRIYPGDVIRIPTGQVALPGGRTKRQGSTRIPDRAEKLTTTTSTGNPKIAMEFFLDQGWTPEQAAGLVANLQAESYDHIDPAAFNAKEQAYGIAQWRGPRKRDFEREMGRPIKGSSLDDQLKFVQWELNNTEKRAGRRLKQATTAAEAAAIVDEFYERSAGIHRQERIALANSLLTAFA